MKRDEKLLNGLESLEPYQILYFVFDIAFSIDSGEQEEVVYSKQYFTRYYGISGETFKKWIQIFCPDLFETYKKKRIFNEEEVNYIFENLGSLPLESEILVDRKEAMKVIYANSNWKKSRQYFEFSLELLDRFPKVNMKLNKLPPKMIFSILKEELEEFSDVRLDRDISFEKRLDTIYQFTDKYRRMSDHDWEVRRRWLRREMSKSDSEKGGS